MMILHGIITARCGPIIIIIIITTTGKQHSCSNACPWLSRKGMQLPSKTPWSLNEVPLQPITLYFYLSIFIPAALCWWDNNNNNNNNNNLAAYRGHTTRDQKEWRSNHDSLKGGRPTCWDVTMVGPVATVSK